MTARRHSTFAIALALLLVGAAGWVIAQTGEGATMTGMGERRMIASRDGTRIAFTKMGRGPAVILVDGAFCYRENGPAPELAPLLAEHYTVYAYDRRGRGDSSDTPPYAIAREVDDLRALVDEAGGAAFAVGVSSGASLALQAAASGVPFTKLALYEPPFVKADPQAQPTEVMRARLQEYLSASDRAGAVKYFLGDIVGVPRPFLFVMPYVMRTTWKRNESVAHTLPYDLTLSTDWSVLTDRRASIVAPTLVIGGEKSPERLRDAVSTVSRALPNAQARMLPGQDHQLRAHVVEPVLREFFDAQ
jgi:pimeloyl-ACP methyl ester carboxylesterase